MSVGGARAEFLRRCKADPLWFGREVLGRRRWSGQEEIRIAVEGHRYTAVVSGNGTGKSHEFASIACEFPLANPGGRVVLVGPTFDAVKHGLYAKVRAAYEQARVPLGGKFLEKEWKIATESDVRIAAPDNPNALQGCRGTRVLILMDEAQGVEPEFWDYLKSLLTAEDSRMVVGGNPLYPTGAFRDAAHDVETWCVVHLDADKHPNIVTGREVIPGAITRLWIAERLKEFGSVDEPRYVARVLGRFPTTASMRQVISLKMLEEASAGTVDVKDVRRIGVDLARSGGDANVLSYYDETRTLIEQREWFEDDTQKTIAMVMEAVNEFGVERENVHIDMGGLGAPIYDSFHALGFHVDGVDFGAEPEYDWAEYTGETTRFVNRRAELYWAMRELLRRRMVCIPKRFVRVWRDLTSVEREADPHDKGGIKLEPKDKVKKKIGRSPDHGDSSVIALSNVGAFAPLVIRG